MNEQYSALRSNVSMLGKVLGDTIKDALGENILDRVETIRKLSKSSRAGNEANRQELLTTLQNLVKRRTAAGGPCLQPVSESGQHR
ncbi:phosphoenolpyruvate carboxylase [Klebsiella pneumoniae subsp. ozaenae]|uniref:Phosphoenolpyruvate carboxylase n=1 Tax=Klebsiella pneumoniae subsp. ozaenae TaxID=574 RepID=A0A378AUU8_KLEPO|nr:phosphoenolpyruvate carboxylase [Klebsiella pneumoniae subsp. ozaenae]